MKRFESEKEEEEALSGFIPTVSELWELARHWSRIGIYMEMAIISGDPEVGDEIQFEANLRLTHIADVIGVDTVKEAIKDVGVEIEKSDPLRFEEIRGRVEQWGDAYTGYQERNRRLGANL